MKTTFKTVITESRREDLKYTEKKVKGVIDKVITELSGKDSARITRLAKQFHKIDVLLAKLQAKRKERNEELTEEVEKLFDQTSDIVYTRIVNTASFVVQVAKQEAGQKKTEVDYEAIYKGLVNLIPMELLPAVEELFEAHTRTWTADPRKPSLKVTPLKPVEPATVKEGMLDAASGKLMSLIKQATVYFKSLYKRMQAWGNTYDAELDELKHQLKG